MTELEKPNVPTIDSLLAASNELENKLEQAGIQDAHEWMFALREMLYDIRRVILELDKFFNMKNVGRQSEEQLMKITNIILYEFLPHIQSHMEDLEKNLLSSTRERRTDKKKRESPDT